MAGGGFPRQHMTGICKSLSGRITEINGGQETL